MKQTSGSPARGRVTYSLGVLLTITGAVALFVQVFANLVFMVYRSFLDVVPPGTDPNGDSLLVIGLIIAIGGPAIILFLMSAATFMKQGTRGWGVAGAILALLATLAFSTGLLYGGGWFVGTVAGNAGTCLVVASMAIKARRPRNPAGKGGRAPGSRVMLVARVAVIGTACGLVAMSALLPVVAVPAPLFPTATAPATAAPTHQNTFYILPIWEWQGDNYTYGEQQMQYMIDVIGGEAYTGEGFVRIGRSVSCWYTANIFGENTTFNGEDYTVGEFNPTHLLQKLELANITATPILFHMNGGNWGQHWSENDAIVAMRDNVSNCQWDQNEVCHPSVRRPGPNDRFWSFWPGSDWEQFRERNIKQALAHIKNWSAENPGLLVGFSTDSEIHLNYNTFESVNVGMNGWPDNYTSWFDYNPGTIQQYREWAEANWSLAEFNQRCGTTFQSWEEVDAPRAPGVVGVKGHPWWETWTDFRVWHVWEAGLRQARWINESGFPREMIWHHQILSEPGEDEARYRRADPIETALNPYCKLGITRYGWISPSTWHSLGTMALADGAGDPIPSWGIFEWNLWTMHEYWAYREMLASIYQYGGHVICPNEWANCSINEGLWIPGDPLPPGVDSLIEDPDCIAEDRCCQERDEHNDCIRCRLRHGNIQFQHALRDFVEVAQAYERGTSPHVRVNPWLVSFYDTYYTSAQYFDREPGIYIMVGTWLACIVLVIVAIVIASRRSKAPTSRTGAPDAA